MRKMLKSKTEKKLAAGIVAIILLAVCLIITTLALVYEVISVNDNIFHTGKIGINLNDGKAVIQEHEFIFEPGMTVKKEFFIENESTYDVYYKLYFDDVSGDLGDVLEVTISDGDKVLYSGTASELGSDDVLAADDVLRVNERKDLEVLFKFPESTGNSAMGSGLAFTMCADATQTKNNPDRLFS